MMTDAVTQCLRSIRVLGLAACLPLGTPLSCDRPTGGSALPATDRSAVSDAGAEPGSMWALIQLARGHRDAGRFTKLKSYLVPEVRASVVEWILSVDRVVAADAGLRYELVESYGSRIARPFDRSSIADVLGIFSREVTFVTQRVETDVAVVTFQVARRTPYERVKLSKRHGVWLIEPDPPIDGAPAAFRDLADATLRVTRIVQRESPAASELNALYDEHVSPVLRRIESLARAHDAMPSPNPTPTDSDSR